MTFADMYVLASSVKIDSSRLKVTVYGKQWHTDPLVMIANFWLPLLKKFSREKRQWVDSKILAANSKLEFLGWIIPPFLDF